MSSNPFITQSTGRPPVTIADILFFSDLKVKFHANLIGNENADALARKSYSDVAGTSKTAGSEEISFHNIFWLAKEKPYKHKVT
jgi:hypothetical protein